MATIGEAVGRLKNKLLLKPCHEFVCPETAIGMEFEFENVRNIPPLLANTQYWADKEDGSLHDRGREFVFIEPLFGMDAYTAIEQIVAEARGANFRTSLRTGIHVHLDVRDMTPPQLIGLIALYLLFEPALYRWAGEGREANNFCIPYYKAENAIAQATAVLNALYDSERGVNTNAVVASNAFNRYAGLNLKSVAQFGSIEFRQLPTTLDFTRIITWINFIMSLKRAALDATASHRFALLGEVFNRPPIEICRRVFGRDADSLLYEGFDSDFEQIGFANALALLLEVDLKQLKEQRHVPEYDQWEEPAPKDADSHKGFRKWVRDAFPKDEGLAVETKPIKPLPFINPPPITGENVWYATADTTTNFNFTDDGFTRG